MHSLRLKVCLGLTVITLAIGGALAWLSYDQAAQLVHGQRLSAGAPLRQLAIVLGLTAGLGALLVGAVGYYLGGILEEPVRSDGSLGLYNQRYFKERLNLEVKRAHRYRRGLALVLVDFDQFKEVNDTYGHGAGDDVLRNVARRIKEACRGTDVVARIGGDELAILCPETALIGAKELAERVRREVASQPVAVAGGVPITVCLGVAHWQEGMGEQEIYALADRALYRAKAGGRNRVCTSQEEGVSGEN